MGGESFAGSRSSIHFFFSSFENIFFRNQNHKRTKVSLHKVSTFYHLKSQNIIRTFITRPGISKKGCLKTSSKATRRRFDAQGSTGYGLQGLFPASKLVLERHVFLFIQVLLDSLQ